MLQRNLTAPWQHTYRNLLREATYLPDPIARKYMLEHVRERYRVHWPYIPTANTGEVPGVRISASHGGDNPNTYQQPLASIMTLNKFQLAAADRRARQLLYLLRRANDGYLKALSRVLMLSYGRTGERRYELLEPLIVGRHRDEPPKSEMAIGISTKEREEYKYRYYAPTPGIRPPERPRLQVRKPGPPSNCPVPFTPPDKLIALIASQSANMYVRAANVRPTIHAVDIVPVTDKTTRWGKKVDERKLMEIWYRKTIAKVLPPLPPDELDVLVKLCKGHGKLDLPKRRCRPVTMTQKTSSPALVERNDESDFEERFLTPEFLIFGPAKGETFEQHARGRPHRITRSLLSKMWLEVLNLVPQLYSEKSENPNKEVWKVEWGAPSLMKSETSAERVARDDDGKNKDGNTKMLPPRNIMDVLFGGVHAITGQKPNLKRELRRQQKLMERIPSAAVEGLDMSRPKDDGGSQPIHSRDNSTR